MNGAPCASLGCGASFRSKICQPRQYADGKLPNRPLSIEYFHLDLFSFLLGVIRHLPRSLGSIRLPRIFWQFVFHDLLHLSVHSTGKHMQPTPIHLLFIRFGVFYACSCVCVLAERALAVRVGTQCEFIRLHVICVIIQTRMQKSKYWKQHGAYMNMWTFRSRRSFGRTSIVECDFR